VIKRTHPNRANIDKLVDELIELHNQTEPRGGERSAEDKHSKALLALTLADSLSSMLTTWAIAHLAGFATSDGSVDKNNHDHELAGEDYRAKDYPPTVNRAVLARFLETKTSSVPLGLVVEALEALTALDFGEAKPLLKAAITSHRGAVFTLAQFRLKALAHVEYRFASGLREVDAREIVARAYRVSPETILTWKKELLPKVLGNEHVKKSAEVAKAHGEYKLDLDKRRFAEDVSDAIRRLEYVFGDERLKQDGQDYNNALRD
jgi:hypothetical protein